VDVLLSTSIIESGLDIPNANTLIVDRGDTFGLSQLYQLRGRVGRAASRAYAYFFHHRKKAPTPVGLERLETIAENTQLGAGYSIAMRDLEMRGAGDLLGTMQHGHIASIGFHLYTRMLAQAVADVKNEGRFVADLQTVLPLKAIGSLVTVDLPFSVGIPPDYIPDESLRLQIYRRIADLDDAGDIHNLKEEFTDRFGALPEEVNNLFTQVRIKLKSESCGLASVAADGNFIVIKYPALPPEIKQREIPDLTLPIRKGRNAYWIPLDNEKKWLALLDSALDDLLAIKKGAQ
jgi:transcription-repair coupling factor (superfamily II helicase)